MTAIVPAVPVELLRDDFVYVPASTTGNKKWGNSNSASNGSLVSVSDGVLTLGPGFTNTTGLGDAPVITSQATFDFVSTGVFVKYEGESGSTPITSPGGFFVFENDSENKAGFSIESGVATVAFPDGTTGPTVTLSDSPWLRVREQNGTAFFAKSADATHWFNVASCDVTLGGASPATAAAVSVVILACTVSNGETSGGVEGSTISFSHLNVMP
jgi:hypothetical protein